MVHSLNNSKIKRLGFSLVTLLLLYLIFSDNSIAREINFKISPETVVIDATYNGTTLSIEGDVPLDSEVIVTVSSKPKDVVLKVKGKVLGLIWMNTKEVLFENVPDLYLVYLPKKLDVEKVGMDFEALLRGIKIKGDVEDEAFLFKEFLKLKKKEGLYNINFDGIKYVQVQDSNKHFLCKIDLPSKLIEGDYIIKAMEFKNSNFISNTSKILHVEERGFPKLVSFLAFNYPTLYGILSTIIAIIAGVLMGILLKGGKGGH